MEQNTERKLLGVNKEYIMNFRKKLRDNTMILLGEINPELAKKAIYKRYTGRNLDLKNPKTFDEKVNWLSLYGQTDEMARLSDKIAVHDFVKEKGLAHILNDIYQVAKKPEDIDWESLPNKFVIKTNNASRTNIIVEDKNKLDIEATNDQLNEWLSADYGRANAEFHYNTIEPKILIERFIDFEGSSPVDYKFFCFNGQPYFVNVMKDRDESGSKYFKAIYDLKWRRIFIQDPAHEQDPEREIGKPSLFDEMVEYARVLSHDFPFVRVDFYQEQDQIIFGEMTFTPRGGNSDNFNEGIQKMLGDLIRINY